MRMRHFEWDGQYPTGCKMFEPDGDILLQYLCFREICVAASTFRPLCSYIKIIYHNTIKLLLTLTKVFGMKKNTLKWHSLTITELSDWKGAAKRNVHKIDRLFARISYLKLSFQIFSSQLYRTLNYIQMRCKKVYWKIYV